MQHQGLTSQSACSGTKLYIFHFLHSFCRSDLGPNIGYEAVGLIDSSLTTIGVWAKGQEEDTPQKSSLDPSDVRTESIGQTSSRSEEPQADTLTSVESDAPTSRLKSPDYRKGLVLYVKDQRIVGILMFNLFNRVSLAKNVIQNRTSTEALQDVVDLFNINQQV